jgi:hypothetical protein
MDFTHSRISAVGHQETVTTLFRAAGERYIAVIQRVLKTKNLHPK